MDAKMNEKRWEYTNRYLRELFGKQDQHLAGLMLDAVEHGLPDISITADVGRLLMILTSLTRGKLALEVGTLGGYSGIWIARGLKPDGKLITIECDLKHAEFAQRQFSTAGVDDRTDIRIGFALDVLQKLHHELEPDSVDLVFIDAEKDEYADYWKLVRRLIAPGGLILADNALGSGDWWIDQEENPTRNAVDTFNRLVEADPKFEVVAIPIRQGVLVGRRMQ